MPEKRDSPKLPPRDLARHRARYDLNDCLTVVCKYVCGREFDKNLSGPDEAFSLAGNDVVKYSTMLLRDQVDPFSVSAINDTAEPVLLPLHPGWDGFQFKSTLESGFLRLNDSSVEALPSLKADTFQLSLEDVPLPDLSAPSTISTSDSVSDFFQSLDGEDEEDEAIDVWVLPDMRKRGSNIPLATWDNFLDKDHQDPAAGYVSEAQPWVLDAILKPRTQDPLRHVKPDILLSAASQLCMGRESVLFLWEEKNQTFVPQWQKITTHGYSPTLLQSCFDDFADTGMAIRSHSQSLTALEDTSAHLSPTHVAFLSTMRSILHTINKYFCLKVPNVASLLQLRGQIPRIATVLEVLELSRNTLESKQTQISSIHSLVREAAKASFSHPASSKMLQSLIIRTCQPLLELLSEQVGLRSTQSRNFLETFTETNVFNEIHWETLFDSNVTDIILEAQQSLKLLRSYSENIPLFSAMVLRSTPLNVFGLGFSFETISKLQLQAVAYEEAMNLLLVPAHSSTTTSMLNTAATENFELEESDVVLSATFEPFALEKGIFSHETNGLKESTEDEIQNQVMLFLERQTSEEPCLPLDFEEVFSLSITPLLSAQHRLLSYSVLQLLFLDHNLLGHLSLQRSFHMLANAFFSSRLSTALFDSDQISGEAVRKTGASTGVRLEARDSWPPAGSELRLVLMSILSDSLSARDRPLADCISFAIRDMPPEDLEKCRDVDSTYALDFLRLQYSAPNEILEAVITPQILHKYDRIFQLLLRTMRLQAVTRSILRDDSGPEGKDGCRDKIVVEMHHFISTVADYCHNVAIETHWMRFERVLLTAKNHLDSQNYEETMRVVKSLGSLRALHEGTLDNIMYFLLLKQKQTATRHILEDIYGIILQFAAERRKHHESGSDGIQSGTDSREGTTKILGEDFRDKVAQFTDALRSEMQIFEQVPDGGLFEDLKGAGEDINMFECLLLRLDMSGYWSRQHGTGMKRRTLSFGLL